MIESVSSADVAVVGGGAAGLATAIFAARSNPFIRVVVLDGARKLGAKILVSGGGRCNVTNVRVKESDFRGGSPAFVRHVLRAFPADRTVAFFREIGVALHEEEHGKLFPDSNQARTVLDALVAEARRIQVILRTDFKVAALQRSADGFLLSSSKERLSARKVVLATGGLSLPKTGSDGSGYLLASGLGHSLIPTTPALAPLLLDGDFHVALSGVSMEVALMVRCEGNRPNRHRGSLLWTHFGVSGPVVLDVSGLWHRAVLEGRFVSISADFLPDSQFEETEARLVDLIRTRPRTLVSTALAGLVPARFADALLRSHGEDPALTLSHWNRDHRRRIVHSLHNWPLPIRGSRGYGFAEVTAGGVPLGEIDSATMKSRICPGLFLVGEILDVDGRIGGFNFQWAWSGGFVAGSAIAREDA